MFHVHSGLLNSCFPHALSLSFKLALALTIHIGICSGLSDVVIITKPPTGTVSCPHCRAQSTVDFPIGGHVNVLSDYKETGPEKNCKF